MRADWPTVALRDLCLIARGGSPRPIKNFITNEPDGINWIKIGDTEKGGRYIDSTAEKIKPAGVSRSRFVEAGSFLLSNSMSFGRPYILRISGCIHDGWLVLEPDYKRVNQDFLYHVLGSRTVFDQFDRLAAGSTVRNLNIGLVEGVKIPLPPLEEQQRIVGVLDEAFEGLARASAHAEANLQNARELFSGTIASEFAKIEISPKRKVGDVAVHSLGKMLDKNKNKGTLRPYLRNLNVRWFNVDTSDLLEMRITDAEVKRYTVRKGDLLICEGGYPGRSSIWEEDDEIFFQKALHRVRFEHEAYSRLLMYFLYMSDQSGALREHFSGAGIQHFTGQALAKFEIPFPSVGVATEMIRTIEAMQRSSIELEGYFQKKIQDLDDLRQSLLQKAFAGELT